MRLITFGTRVVAVLTVLAASAACGNAVGSDSDGGQSPVIAVQDWNAYPTAEVVGRLSLEEGCLLVGDSVAFWADGTSWDPAHRSVTFDSGEPIKIGDQFSGGGGHYSRGDLGGLSGVDVDAVIDCLERTGTNDAVLVVPASLT